MISLLPVSGWLLFGSIGYIVGHFCGNANLGLAIGIAIATGITCFWK